LLERWFDHPRWSSLAAWVVVFVLGALTSWYVAVMMLLVNGIVGVSLVVIREERQRAGVASPEPSSTRWRQRLLQLPCAAVVVLLLVLPFARHYVGMRGAPGEAEANAATLASYVVPPENTVVGRWWKATIDDRPGSIWGEQTLFAGWIALALAGVGLVGLVRRRATSRRAWLFAVLGVTGFLLSLGPSPAISAGGLLAPFGWLAVLPGFEGMRAPARFGIVAMLGVAGLAAFGAVELVRLLRGRHGVLLVVAPLMLMEWFVVGFPAGKPAPLDVPAIYRTEEVRAARSIVSLPEYWGTTDWVRGGDYLYFSMTHWRPIVNGFGRTEPAGFATLVNKVRNFPSEAAGLRALGLQYVIVHADRYPEHGRDILAAARACTGCRLVRQIGSDYLFELSGS